MDEELPRLRAMLAEVCGIDEDRVRDDVLLVHYGLDSVRALDLIVGIEDAFGVQIPDEAAAKMTTLRDVADYVRARQLASA